MKRTSTKPRMLTKLVDAVAGSFTPQSAKKIRAIKPDKRLQARVRYLGEQSNSGKLTPEEHEEYGQIIRESTMISILQSRARRFLADQQ